MTSERRLLTQIEHGDAPLLPVTRWLNVRIKAEDIAGIVFLFDRLQATVVVAEGVAQQTFTFLAEAGKVEIHAPLLRVRLHPLPEVARPGKVSRIVHGLAPDRVDG